MEPLLALRAIIGRAPADCSIWRKGFPMLPRSRRLVVLALFAALLSAAVLVVGCTSRTASAKPASNGFLFCFWNVENLFDDRDDSRTGADRDYDDWFARDPAVLQLKLDHLSEALVKLNGGKGPDILAIVEVESVRAAELLRDALNKKLNDPSLHYSHVLMKEVRAGRHIAPAIFTRLPVRGDQTQLHGRQLRILEGHIVVNDHDLVVLATHWTSHVTDDKQGVQRDKYGDQIYGVFKGMVRSNPNVDLLVCGDFNDPPDAHAVTDHLHATGDLERVLRPTGEPNLYNLFARRDAETLGTIYHQGRWATYDQICVAPALVRAGGGWTVDVKSATTVNTLVRPGDRHMRPWRFGNPHDRFARGYSDHFPVTVRLKVGG